MGEPLFDGTLSFRGGQNAGLLPDRIGEDQYASGVNLSTKDGGVGPRSGFTFLDIEVLTSGGVQISSGATANYSEIFRSGKFQGAHHYIADSGEYIIAVISGVIFCINPEKQTATVLTLDAEDPVASPLEDFVEADVTRLDQYRRRFNMSDAGRFMTIYEYPAYPVIIDGGEARRANPDAEDAFGNPTPEIPNGIIGAYNQSRLFVGSAVHEFTGGDPVGSSAAPNAPITFQEVLLPAADFLGQVFSLGSTNQNNPITAMGFLQVADTSRGLGPLFIATKDSLYTFRTDLPRSQWEETRFGSLLLFNAGVAGQRAFTNLNSDLFFMSGDGRIRSLSISVSEQQKFANTPIDREVRNWVVFDDKDLAELSVAQAHNNKVYFTVNPFRTTARDLYGDEVIDYAFGGFVVLELDNISGALSDAVPAWAGLWQGINPMDMVVVNNELYVFAKDPGAVNSLYRVDDDKTYDTFKDETRLITSRIYSKEYIYQNRFTLKEESTVEPTFSDLSGDIKVVIDRKTEASGNWLHWRTWEHEAKDEECNFESSEVQPVLLPHSFRDLGFGSPVDEYDDPCDSVTGDDLRYFKREQFRLTITGKNWKLQAFRAKSEVQEDSELINISCDKLVGKTVEKDCSDVSDWYIHSTPFVGESCQ